MRICITGIAGFVGSRLATAIVQAVPGVRVTGIDNLSRRGSERNLRPLERLGCAFVHGDIRSEADVAGLPPCDWVIDCAAIPSVMAGLGGDAARLVGHNLVGTLTLLEKCRRDGAGFLMLSTSRVYSIPSLLNLPLTEGPTRYEFNPEGPYPPGASPRGIAEEFSTAAPVSLYGATKLASEVVALEYGSSFGFPVRINRCGVIAGAGQFGKIDQGVVSFWVYQWLTGRPLSYIGFGGRGAQVRDFLSPDDLARLVLAQLREPGRPGPRVCNAGGGTGSAISLRELSDYCAERFGVRRELSSVPETRPFDVPLYVTDNTLVGRTWDWRPEKPARATLDEIADWAEANRALLEVGF